MTEDQARAVCRLLRLTVVVHDDPYWHYHCRCCKGHSQSYEVGYRPDLNACDYPCQHEEGCAVPVVEAMLLTEVIEPAVALGAAPGVEE